MFCCSMKDLEVIRVKIDSISHLKNQMSMSSRLTSLYGSTVSTHITGLQLALYFMFEIREKLHSVKPSENLSPDKYFRWKNVECLLFCFLKY